MGIRAPRVMRQLSVTLRGTMFSVLAYRVTQLLMEGDIEIAILF